MSCQFCGFDWCNGSCVSQNTTIVIPSPIPPWARPPVASAYQTLINDGSIVLSSPLVLLVQVNPKAPVAPYIATLPNGNYVGQSITVMIPAASVQATQTWSVQGIITGGTQVVLNTAGPTVILQWDGGSWSQIGGSGEVKP